MIYHDSVEQQDESSYGHDVNGREPPKKVIVRSKAKRNDIFHDPCRSPFGNPGISGSRREIGEE
jgi:hypothetical protein